MLHCPLILPLVWSRIYGLESLSQISKILRTLAGQAMRRFWPELRVSHTEFFYLVNMLVLQVNSSECGSVRDTNFVLYVFSIHLDHSQFFGMLI